MSEIVRFSDACSTTPTASKPPAAELAVHRERGVGRRRVLHVDADEVVPHARAVHELLQVTLAEVEVEHEPERRRLDADVRVEVPAVDLREHVLVGRGDRVASPRRP